MAISVQAIPERITEGGVVTLQAAPPAIGAGITYHFAWTLDGGFLLDPPAQQSDPIVHWDTTGLRPAAYRARVKATLQSPIELTTDNGPPQEDSGEVTIILDVRPVSKGDILPVTLRRTATEPTPDLPLWVVIRKSTEALSFTNYSRFMNVVLCGEPVATQGFDDYELSRIPDKASKLNDLRQKRFLPYNDADAYRLLKVATEAFVIVNCGVALTTFPFASEDLDDLLRRISVDGRVVDLNTLWRSYLEVVNGTQSQTLPYLALIRRKLPDAQLKNAIFSDTDLPQECFGILREKLTNPCFVELLWSYWHEEGMLVQTLNALSRRFQNVRSPGHGDPLAMLEIDPLLPLNNLLWGYIQDEQHRLSVVRRAYEYDHHYGLTLIGKAVPRLHAADSRSKFLEAFHTLLNLAASFFRQDDDTTVVADGFPMLNALKEVHLLLTEGAHNQFGDLPSTARQEMLMEQWILARPEFREFLPTRIMVAYPEPWMDRVDAMKRLQGWTDASIMHFRNLAMFGEQILLSVRFGAWGDTNDPRQAANWGRYWRAEIQGYIHAYRTVTGVDLTTEPMDYKPMDYKPMDYKPVDYTMPGILIRERMAKQLHSRRDLETRMEVRHEAGIPL